MGGVIFRRFTLNRDESGVHLGHERLALTTTYQAPLRGILIG